jgi:hypothetical protein
MSLLSQSWELWALFLSWCKAKKKATCRKINTTLACRLRQEKFSCHLFLTVWCAKRIILQRLPKFLSN